ncbi:putative low specificity L-threonine aldolase [Nadsonia fulvescens var. elongata DSM 6958]|uniref:low-specificity L-threonine aldolase n=1 Tax=Nadsonia fulvescens var. elongata DSM 6958 TaxID=857566 RepID=A0A1E3PNS1_9ASCO|nr:putative low specificity L-threonine aldolase [Nadsonia fulvescens var. elongata DSM 6958]
MALPTTIKAHSPSPAGIDFRSDTFTSPCEAMFAAMLEASLGDSVYNEDESTNQLQNMLAEWCGQEAGLFCVTGTLSNQIAIRTHLHQPPHSVLCDYRSHIYAHEAGGLATLSQAMVIPVRPANKVYMTLDDVKENIIPYSGDIHEAPTRVISLENTLDGALMPIKSIHEISEFAHANGYLVHLDGARLWEASAATGITLKEYGRFFDSMSLCLSKGLGAPIGTILVGSAEFIRKANWFKKQNGGGIRQSGPLAAAATVAIMQNWPKLKAVHAKTKDLAQYCVSLGYKLTMPADTNMIWLDLKGAGITNEDLIDECIKNSIKSFGYRIVLHHQTTDYAIDMMKLSLKNVMDRAIAEGRGAIETKEKSSYYNTSKDTK